jgi:hypothetical protein
MSGLQDIEESTTFQIAKDEKDLARKRTSEIIRQAIGAMTAVFRTASCDFSRLNMEIAKTTKISTTLTHPQGAIICRSS